MSPLGTLAVIGLAGGALAPGAVASEQSLEVDLSTGQAVHVLPILTPRNAGVASPRLALRYTSGAARRVVGPFGLGWSLDGVSAIERDRRAGPPFAHGTRCGEAPCYRPDLVLDGEPLVCRDGVCDGRFQLVRDRGVRVRRLPEGDGFEVVERGGVRRTYGSGPSSRIVNPKNGEVFRWLLDRQEDPHGNWIAYEYEEGLGVRPLRALRYAQRGAPANRSVELLREPRPDRAVDYSAGFRRETVSRVRRIEVRAAEDQLVTAYELRYAQSPDSGRSLLEQVWRESPQGERLPAHTFRYTASARRFAATPADVCAGPCPVGDLDEPGPPGSAFANQGRYHFVDLDGDGRVDLHAIASWPELQRQDGDPGGPTLRYPGRPDGFAPTAEVWTPHFAPRSVAWEDGATVTHALLDVDGDGLADAFPIFDRENPEDPAPRYRPGTRDGLSETARSVEGVLPGLLRRVSGPEPGSVETELAFTDLDGDGLPDFVVAGDGLDDDPPRPETGPWSLHRNLGRTAQGIAFATEPEVWTNPLGAPIERAEDSDGVYRRSFVRLADVNGDALPDHLWLDAQGLGVAYNFGAGFDAPERVLARSDTTLELPALGFDQAGCRTIELVDLNGDGLLDLVATRWSGAFPARNRPNEDPWHVLLGTGDGFSADVALWAIPGEEQGADASCVRGATPFVSGLVDLDADGLPDHHGSRLSEFFLAEGPVPDLLERVGLPSGTEISVRYAASSELADETESAANPALGIALPVVVERTRVPGNEWSAARRSRFHYAGGSYDREARELRGFARVTRVEQAEPPSETASEFATDPVCAGRLRGREVREAGRVLVRERHTYRIVSGATASACLRQSTRFESVEGDEAGRRISETRFDYGSDPARTAYRLFGIERRGEVTADGVDVVGDERSDVLRYAEPIDPDRGPLDAVREQVVRDAAGALLRRTLWVYVAGGDRVERGSVRLAARLWAEPAGSGPERFAIDRFGYDAYGQLAWHVGPPSEDDRDGLRTTRTYDPIYATFPVREVHGADAPIPLAYVRTYGDCAPGRAPPPGLDLPCHEVDPAGRVRRLGYDGFGRIVARSHPNGRDERFAYTHEAGAWVTRRRFRVAGLELVFAEARDERGALLWSETPGSAFERVRSEWRYDAFGRLTETILPHFPGDAPARREIRRDALGRPVEQTEPGGWIRTRWSRGPWLETERLREGPRGADRVLRRITRRLDASGSTVRELYYPDPEREDDVLTVVREYDALGRLVRLADPIAADPGLCSAYSLGVACSKQSHALEVQYDTLGRRVLLDDPDLGRVHFRFDAAGLLRERSDAAGRVVSLRYDELRRPLERRHGPAGRGLPDVRYVYQDDAGRPGFGELAAIVPIGGDAHTRVDFAYDAAGRATEMQQTTDGTSYRVQRSFDELDREVRRTAPNGAVYQFWYSGLRLKAISTEGLSVLASASHRADGRAELLTIGVASEPRTVLPQLAVRQRYDSAGRLWRIDGVRRGQRRAFQLLQRLDGLGAPLEERSILGDRKETVRRFRYDGLGQLVWASGPFESGEEAVDWTFAYDPLGNLREERSSTGVVERFEYTDWASPRLLTAHEHAGGVDWFAFDAAGHPTHRNGLPFRFAADGSLHRPPGTNDSYASIPWPDGRAVRVAEQGPSGTRVRVGEDFEHDHASGRVLQHFRVDGRWIATLVFESDGERRLLAHVTDGLGSLRAVVDERGELVHTLRYDPFGVVVAEAGGSPIRQRFNGRLRSRGSSWLDYGARFYAPGLRRFLSPDPMLAGSSPPGSNRFAYVMNAPTRWVDPTGNLPVPAFPAVMPPSLADDRPEPDVEQLERGARAVEAAGAALLVHPSPRVKVVGAFLVLIGQLGQWVANEERIDQQAPTPASRPPQLDVPNSRLYFPAFIIGHWVDFW